MNQQTKLVGSRPVSSSSSCSSAGSCGAALAAPPAFLAALAARLTPQTKTGPGAAYERVSCLGEGAFGAVWLARRHDNGQRVALKEIPRSNIATEEQVRRLWDERNALLAVRAARQNAEQEPKVSPALTALVESYTTPMTLCLIMDLVDGPPLHDLIRRARRLPEELVRWYTAELALAVGWLHNAGWLFRDLKMSNVVISSKDNRAKLVDFGFAKQANKASSVVGTLHAMAPEVIRCAGVTMEDETEATESLAPVMDYGQAADWWSLGVLLFELLAGKPPFGYHEEVHLEGSTILAKQARAADAGLPWPGEFSTSMEARQTVQALLQTDTEKRLGAHGGLEEIRGHAFYQRTDWTAVACEEGRGPLVPEALAEAAKVLAEDESSRRRPRRGQAMMAPADSDLDDPDPFEGF